jgi:hypothetical protein
MLCDALHPDRYLPGEHQMKANEAPHFHVTSVALASLAGFGIIAACIGAVLGAATVSVLTKRTRNSRSNDHVLAPDKVGLQSKFSC